jgi:hypothetical protein
MKWDEGLVLPPRYSILAFRVNFINRTQVGGSISNLGFEIIVSAKMEFENPIWTTDDKLSNPWHNVHITFNSYLLWSVFNFAR